MPGALLPVVVTLLPAPPSPSENVKATFPIEPPLPPATLLSPSLPLPPAPPFWRIRIPAVPSAKAARVLSSIPRVTSWLPLPLPLG
ncbi:hypothetical protein [Mangrovicoccus ximenensis]|uniref:hypothetical protein n=1 Tax=Mangrovicoccus ximenensis TaxID=1911570 RepID=UPI0011AE907C|nr:hypothetical protein [Mangrovicoccus ximenensis]